MPDNTTHEARLGTPLTGRTVTVIVPLYDEAQTIAPLIQGVWAQLQPGRDHVILVNDGSTDDSGARCDHIAAATPGVSVIHFPENRGKTAALAAGFAAARGDIVITMDADLQDDPAEIPRLLQALDNGLDLVCGWKQHRHDPRTKTWPSRLYNAFCARAFGLRLRDMNSGFKAMRSEVARAAILKHDYHRLIPAIAAAQGFVVGEIPVRHHPRRHGASKFGVERYWRGLRDVARLWLEIKLGRIRRVARRETQR